LTKGFSNNIFGELVKMSIEQVSRSKSFNGFQCVYKHFSEILNCKMSFSLYHPAPGETLNEKFHVLFYLSGLTCSELNFIQKSGFQRFASEHRIIVVGPDTSPRNTGIPGENDTWDFGCGASFYVDSTLEPWSSQWKMYTYVSKELPDLIAENFPTSGKFGIMGHSMGGHGAMVISLRNPDLFSSISALAPICNPSKTDLKLAGYLGNEKEKWAPLYDSCEIIKNYDGEFREILVDQGLDDEFLDKILLPKNLNKAASANPDRIKVDMRLHEGFDHSYFFVATFIGDHIRFHANNFNKK